MAFSEAFDSVDYDYLDLKMEALEITGWANTWANSLPKRMVFIVRAGVTLRSLRHAS